MDDLAEPRDESLTLSGSELLRALERLRDGAPDGVLAFDGDGTLWSGDIGEDVFREAVAEERIGEPARAALVREAAAHDLDASGTPSRIAARLFEAYLAGRYPERAVCEMMTWCYAGWSAAHVREYARRTFEKHGLRSRLTAELEPVLRWARAVGLRTVVVSASPQLLVEEAAALRGIPAANVTASRAQLEADQVAPRMAAVLPYAHDKVNALAALAGASPLLATFGDNVFDIELLTAARLGVAVRPKPALRLRLPSLPHIRVLEPL